MVLERVLEADDVEAHPWHAFVFGFVVVLVASLLSVATMKAYSSLVVIGVASIASLPLMFRIARQEETYDMSDADEVSTLEHHVKALKAFLALFIGFTLGFALLFSVASWDTNNALFKSQVETIQGVNDITGAASEPAIEERFVDGNHTFEVNGVPDNTTGSWFIDGQLVSDNVKAATPYTYTGSRDSYEVSYVYEEEGEMQRVDRAVSLGNAKLSRFNTIFSNNLHVLFWCILFSFVLGSGAIFILAWNASVIGVAIGDFIRSNVAAAGAGMTSTAGYAGIILEGLTKYAVHGIPEITGYILAALASAILSIAVMRNEWNKPQFNHVLVDASILIVLSVAVLGVAGLLEVYVTPAVF